MIKMISLYYELAAICGMEEGVKDLENECHGNRVECLEYVL